MIRTALLLPLPFVAAWLGVKAGMHLTRGRWRAAPWSVSLWSTLAWLVAWVAMRALTTLLGPWALLLAHAGGSLFGGFVGVYRRLPAR